MQKVLIVTYYWPPAGGPGVQRWLFFASYLREFGIAPVIYTPQNPHYPILDKALKGQVPREIEVWQREIWEPYRLAGWLGRKRTRRISSGIINRKKPSFLERFLLWTRGNLFIPDARKYWVKPSIKHLRQRLRQEGIRTVITTGPPHSMHLIGLGLKEADRGLRWIADFRDPWTSIGYHQALYLGKYARNRHKTLEAKVLKTADAVVTTSQRTREEFQGITDRPVHVITNGYSGARNRKGQPEGPFRLAHIGSLLSGRNPLALWKALAGLVRTHAGFGNDLEIELTGVVSEEVLRSLRDHHLEPYLTLHPYVSHGRALEMQRHAQVLLLLEIDAPETRGIIPGKLFEYMAASRPVLGIGPAGWEAGELLQSCGCGAFYGYDEEAAISAKLLEWYTAYQEGTLEMEAEGVAGFHRRALTERLVKEVLWA